MICPLRDIAVSIDLQESQVHCREGETPQQAVDRFTCCQGAVCAWWVPEAGACATRVLAAEAIRPRLEHDRAIARYEESH